MAERYREGLSARTRLLSWSMAKSFTNALVGIMYGDGLVDVFAPTGIPEWQGDDRATITLNDLMQMQSGLEWNEDYGNRSEDRKSTRLNSSHTDSSRMPSSA